MIGDFIPRVNCSVASGDCFTEGRCLRDCNSANARDVEVRLRELERTVALLMRERSTPKGFGGGAFGDG